LNGVVRRVSVRGCGDWAVDTNMHTLRSDTHHSSMQANVCCSLPSVLSDTRAPSCRRQCRRISSRRCLLLDKMYLCTHTKSKCLGQKFSCAVQSFAMHAATPTLSVFIAWATAACIPSLTHSACLFVCLFSCCHVCSQTDHNDATWATCSRTADG
jgi:hypothetical protein